jgi:hypothetical protein
MIIKRIDMFLKPTLKLYYNGLHILKVKHHNYLYHIGQQILVMQIFQEINNTCGTPNYKSNIIHDYKLANVTCHHS